MKRSKFIIYIGFILISFGSCKKEADNIFTMFKGISVTFHDDSPNSVTGDKLLNDGDEVQISFTIASEDEEMYKIVIDSTRGNGQVAQREILTKADERNSYSGVINHKMARDGNVTFRFYALDRLNNYIGDGYKTITLEGAPSYIHLPNRHVYLPKPGSYDLPSFYSISEGKAFDYLIGEANSANIDFGIYVLPDSRTAHLNRASFNLYSISTPNNPYPPYDISNWQKRSTLFSRPIKAGTNTFNQVLVSSSTIEAEAKKSNINLLQTDITEWDSALSPGNMVYFLTPEGKYGAMLINQSTIDLEGRGYLSISVKNQK